MARLYTDVQEPLLNSATSAFGGNPYASSGNNDDNSELDDYFINFQTINFFLFKTYLETGSIESRVGRLH